jgi:hypothetical protein
MRAGSNRSWPLTGRHHDSSGLKAFPAPRQVNVVVRQPIGGAPLNTVGFRAHQCQECRDALWAVAPLYAYQRPELWSVARELNRITPPGALMIVADDGDPRAIYYSQRKG